jgi:ankyrin repeat protein
VTSLTDILGAVYRKDRAMLEQLTPGELNVRDPDGRTPLIHAILAEDADVAIVQLLIDRGANANVHDTGEKWTPLHFAARDQNAPIVRSLLEAGAAVDALDVFGNTPLWRSVMNSTEDLSAIRALLEHGADPGRENSRGISPTDLARETGRTDILALLEGKK